MARKPARSRKSSASKKAPAGKSGDRIVLRTGEALVEAEPAWSAAEPEIVIGELDGPVGYAIAQLVGDQVKGHTRVFAILNSDVQVKPATVMVSKVTVKSSRYTNILMGTVQAAIAHAVLDCVRSGAIPKSKVNDLGIIVSVWLDPGVLADDALSALVLNAGLDWREVDCLRTYVAYYEQIQGTLAAPYLRETLLGNPVAARLMLAYFRARLDPQLAHRLSARRSVPAAPRRFRSPSRWESGETIERHSLPFRDEIGPCRFPIAS